MLNSTTPSSYQSTMLILGMISLPLFFICWYFENQAVNTEKEEI